MNYGRAGTSFWVEITPRKRARETTEAETGKKRHHGDDMETDGDDKITESGNFAQLCLSVRTGVCQI
jgi:hypothetical protein